MRKVTLLRHLKKFSTCVSSLLTTFLGHPIAYACSRWAYRFPNDKKFSISTAYYMTIKTKTTVLLSSLPIASEEQVFSDGWCAGLFRRKSRRRCRKRREDSGTKKTADGSIDGLDEISNLGFATVTRKLISGSSLFNQPAIGLNSRPCRPCIHHCMKVGHDCRLTTVHLFSQFRSRFPWTMFPIELRWSIRTLRLSSPLQNITKQYSAVFFSP